MEVCIWKLYLFLACSSFIHWAGVMGAPTLSPLSLSSSLRMYYVLLSHPTDVASIQAKLTVLVGPPESANLVDLIQSSKAVGEVDGSSGFMGSRNASEREHAHAL